VNIELITSVDRLEGTLYFEFHPGAYGGNHWRTESVYLHLYVFDLVANVFVAEIPEFSYFGPTTISGRRVEKLAKALDEFAAAVNSAETPDAVWQPIEGNVHRGLIRPTGRLDHGQRAGEHQLRDLSRWLRGVAARSEPVSILGI